MQGYRRKQEAPLGHGFVHLWPAHGPFGGSGLHSGACMGIVYYPEPSFPACAARFRSSPSCSLRPPSRNRNGERRPSRWPRPR